MDFINEKGISLAEKILTKISEKLETDVESEEKGGTNEEEKPILPKFNFPTDEENKNMSLEEREQYGKDLSKHRKDLTQYKKDLDQYFAVINQRQKDRSQRILELEESIAENERNEEKIDVNYSDDEDDDIEESSISDEDTDFSSIRL